MRAFLPQWLAAILIAAYFCNPISWAAALDSKPYHVRLEIQLGHSSRVNSAVFSRDGYLVLTASLDSTARLWDTASGRELHRFLHDGSVNSAVFSPDAGAILTASDDKTARLWDAAGGQELRRFSHNGSVTSAFFSPDGRTILTASRDDKKALLWDAISGQELRRFAGHTGFVSSAVFSPDGHLVLTTSHDETARIWNPKNGKQLERIDGVSSAVFDLTQQQRTAR